MFIAAGIAPLTTVAALVVLVVASASCAITGFSEAQRDYATLTMYLRVFTSFFSSADIQATDLDDATQLIEFTLCVGTRGGGCGARHTSKAHRFR